MGPFFLVVLEKEEREDARTGKKMVMRGENETNRRLFWVRSLRFRCRCNIHVISVQKK